MNLSGILSTCVAAAFLASSGILGGCSRSPSDSDAPSIRLNTPLITDYRAEEITELTLTQNDPSTQSNWTASLTRPAVNSVASTSGHLDPKAEWVIQSAPGGQQLLDRRADSAFVNHLLSLLATFQAVDEAPRGPPASFGLEPPRFGIRASGNGKSFAVNLGFPAPKGAGSYTDIPGPPASRIVVGSGSMIEMLGMIQSFDVLRRRTLSNLSADDVDEIELWAKGQKLIYAQRQGDDWADAHQKKLRAPLQATLSETLEALTHLRIQSFLDDSPAARNPQARLKKAEYRAILKDRSGTPMEIRLTRIGDRLWGSSTSRGEAVFEMHPDSTRFWNPSNFSGK